MNTYAQRVIYGFTSPPNVSYLFTTILRKFNSDKVYNYLRDNDDALLRNFEHKLNNLIPSAYIIGKDTERLPNISAISIPSIKNEIIVMSCDMEGYAISAGSACSSGRITESHVLKAMELPSHIIESAFRISIDNTITSQDLDRFLNTLVNICVSLKVKVNDKIEVLI